jgi:hypothetical protein
MITDAKINICKFLKVLHWQCTGEDEEKQKEHVSIAGSLVQVRIPSVLLPSKTA